jgi:hypothetical protein
VDGPGTGTSTGTVELDLNDKSYEPNDGGGSISQAACMSYPPDQAVVLVGHGALRPVAGSVRLKPQANGFSRTSVIMTAHRVAGDSGNGPESDRFRA